MSDSREQARAQRVKDRSRWPGTLMRLEDMPESERVTGSPAELMGMVTELTRAAWAMRGAEGVFPNYPRAQAPGRVLRSTLVVNEP